MNQDVQVRSEGQQPRSRSSRRRWLLAISATAAVAVGALGVLAVMHERSSSPPRSSPPPAKPPTATAPPDPGVALPAVTVPPKAVPPPGVRPQSQLAAWATGLSDRLNIPKAALEAYGYAAAAVDAENPNCRLTWTTLAGIGHVESNHGRYNGAKLDAHGKPSITIRGLPLDGRPGFKAIKDTDGGKLDGDAVWDRAMGPLQFIPTTWKQWGADSDGDGVASPDDLDDAALAAARYLCSAGGDVGTSDGWWRAVTTYNESRAYGQDVLDYGAQYGRRSRSS